MAYMSTRRVRKYASQLLVSASESGVTIQIFRGPKDSDIGWAYDYPTVAEYTNVTPSSLFRVFMYTLKASQPD